MKKLDPVGEHVPAAPPGSANYKLPNVNYQMQTMQTTKLPTTNPLICVFLGGGDDMESGRLSFDGLL